MQRRNFSASRNLVCMMSSSWFGMSGRTIWCMISHHIFFFCVVMKRGAHTHSANVVHLLTLWHGTPVVLQLLIFGYLLQILSVHGARGTDCSTCKGFCCGHYKITIVSCDNHNASVISKPPSVVLKEQFTTNKDIPDLESIAKKVLLLTEECRIWLDHLQTILDNRRRGAKKAAATRRAKATSKKAGTPVQVETPQSQVCVCVRHCVCVVHVRALQRLTWYVLPVDEINRFPLKCQRVTRSISVVTVENNINRKLKSRSYG